MNIRLLQLAVVLITQMAGTIASAADDLIIADLEGTTYGNWIVEGTAFGTRPARGVLPGQMHVGESLSPTELTIN